MVVNVKIFKNIDYLCSVKRSNMKTLSMKSDETNPQIYHIYQFTQ